MNKILMSIMLVIFTSMSFASESKIYGIEEHREGDKIWPAMAWVLYPSGELEIIKKYSDEDTAAIETGTYTIENGKISIKVLNSTCKREEWASYSDEGEFPNEEKLGVYSKVNSSFLDQHLSFKSTGCLLDRP